MERIDIGYEKNDFDWFIYDVPFLRKMEHESATSREKLQYQPDKLAQQSKDAITSINTVQKELQTIKITQ